MRDILFKAKRQNWAELPKEKQWVIGYLVKVQNGNYTALGYKECEEFAIVTKFSSGGIEFSAIDEDTVCQYTGLTDKNGNKIWENDVVKDTDIHLLGSVEYDEEHGMYVINEVNDGYQNFQEFWSCTEVIGNVFDNPELLER